jgi:hypothetical protein
MRLINVNEDQKVIKDVLNVVLQEENVVKVHHTHSLSLGNLRALPQENLMWLKRAFACGFMTVADVNL